MNRALLRKRLRSSSGGGGEGGGGGGGSYAHLAPVYTLPYTEAGPSMTYNSTTGLTEGTVFDTSWFSRTWLGTNAVNIWTVKTTGGTYGPSQLQTALNDAATANVTTVIVVDDGLNCTLTADLPAKSGTPAWTATVSASWWAGTWVPTGARYLNPDTESGNLFTITAPATNNARALTANGANRSRYAFVGCRFRRTTSAGLTGSVLVEISNPSATDVSQLPHSHIFQWCWVDGVWKQSSSYYETRRGIGADGYKCAVLNSALTGFAGTGSDPQAIAAFNGAGRLKVTDCLLEGAGENFLAGGSGRNANFLQADFEFRRCYFVKRQDWNPSSSLWSGAAPVPVVKNLFEVKVGKRFLVEACVFENAWAQAQAGKALSLKVNGTSSPYAIESSDITIRLCKWLNTGQAVSLLGAEEITSSSWTAGTKPLGRVDLRGNLFEKGIRAQLNAPIYNDIEAVGVIVLPATSDAADPLNQPMGATTIRYNTFINRETTPTGKHLSLPALPYSAFDFSDNIMDQGAQYGMRIEGGAVSAAALVAENVTPARNVLTAESDAGWMVRADFQTPFPDQYNPAALWPANRTGIGFTDWTAKDYSLSGGSAVKGLGAGGTDPGAPIALLDSVTANIRKTDLSFLQVTFV